MSTFDDTYERTKLEFSWIRSPVKATRQGQDVQ